MEAVVKKTFHRLIPQEIHCLFTLLQTIVTQSQDLVPNMILIVLVRINVF